MRKKVTGKRKNSNNPCFQRTQLYYDSFKGEGAALKFSK
jgi:hypothetical protein